MRTAPFLLRVALALGLTLSAACATSRKQIPTHEGQQQVQGANGFQAQAQADERTWAEPVPVLINALPGGRLQLSAPVSAPHSSLVRLGVEEIRPLLAAFGAFRPPVRPRLRLMLEARGATGPNRGTTAPWELRLREDFFSQYGPALLSVPDSLETSRLYLALKLSTRYMDDGIREAARNACPPASRSLET